MSDSSRKKAQAWPYPRHVAFEKQLREANAVWFSKRDYSVNHQKPYILETWDDWPRNIILPEVAQYIQREQKQRQQAKKPFPLHKYIHHGLSSQAMLFNLVGPLVVEKNLSPLKLAFEKAGINWPDEEVSPMFEVENREIFNEDTGQPTSIDLVLQGHNGAGSLFIEAKLIESEFGGCSIFADGDCSGCNPVANFDHCFLHHIGRQYWILMKKYGFLQGPAGASPICPLALYYQFFREILFSIESGGDFVLLFDQRNPTFFHHDSANDRSLMPFLISFVPQDLKGRIHAISIQQIIAAYHEYGDFAWLVEFEKKYGLIED